jgi:hypothetical protein
LLAGVTTLIGLLPAGAAIGGVILHPVAAHGELESLRGALEALSENGRSLPHDVSLRAPAGAG